ncbi:hypothetical protein [Bacillus sp. FJAT-28004]|uniref:hypothetical protein n=1 Tax=Bacillus sp. FJAT-28004 TaxID=1679165 RepID=UPI0006B4B130|nr:hypothetical protein [Bacillus sp. FJAT-28004]
MKALKMVSICLIGILIIFAAFTVSKSVIDNINFQHVEVKPAVINEIRDDQTYPEDIDKMISHSLTGTKETALPVKTNQNYVLHEDKLYVTNNQGKTWLQVPDDDYLGYARITEYIETIEESNIYTSNEKITIVYGGRGSENISVISSDSKGELWSVGSISKTATHDLKNGYGEMFIDFLADDRTGYLVAVRNEGSTENKILAYRSVNRGVTWDYVDINEGLYDEIMSHFRL